MFASCSDWQVEVRRSKRPPNEAGYNRAMDLTLAFDDNLVGGNDALFNGLDSPNIDVINTFLGNLAMRPELATANAIW